MDSNGDIQDFNDSFINLHGALNGFSHVDPRFSLRLDNNERRENHNERNNHDRKRNYLQLAGLHV